MFINSLTTELECSNYLLFADDLKIYIRIDNIINCLDLQNDINKIHNWSDKNELPLNIGKCNILTFTRKKDPIIYDYKITDISLTRADTIRDLGIMFDSQLTFNNHIFSLVNKATKMYGFIVRNTRYFTNLQCIRHLYITFVRSQLEYCAVVWSPYYQYQIYNVEKVQNRVLRYMYFKETGSYDLMVAKSELRERYNCPTLEQRRKVHHIIYLHKLLHGNVDDSPFLSLISFNVPTHFARAFRTFYLKRANTNHQMNSPLYSMCNIYNMIQQNCDIFSISLRSLKHMLKELL